MDAYFAPNHWPSAIAAIRRSGPNEHRLAFDTIFTSPRLVPEIPNSITDAAVLPQPVPSAHNHYPALEPTPLFSTAGTRTRGSHRSSARPRALTREELAKLETLIESLPAGPAATFRARLKDGCSPDA